LMLVGMLLSQLWGIVIALSKPGALHRDNAET